MAADQSLVQGAYRAAMGGTRPGGDGMSKGMDKLMDLSADLVTDISKKRQEVQKKGNELSEKILQTGGSLGTGWLDAVTTEVEGQHKDYSKNAKWGNKKGTRKGMQDLNGLSAQVAGIKSFTTDVANSIADKDFSDGAKPEDLAKFNAFLANDTPKKTFKDENGDTQFSIEVDGNWIPVKEVESLYNKSKKDFGSTKDIRKTLLEVSDLGVNDAKMGPNNASNNFDKVKTTARMNDIISKGNINSLIHDDVLDTGVPFSKAILEHPMIAGASYKELGLDPKFDLDGNGLLDGEERDAFSDEEKAKLVSALTDETNDFYKPDVTQGLLANYFGMVAEENYNNKFQKNAKSTPYADYDNASEDEKAEIRKWHMNNTSI
tara:strand:+ start:11707 stop:12834 length:1128 start_codon:yes stop_codon:yes gene_type:complete